MIADDSKLYVCGFVTDGGTGGFEWDLDRGKIVAFQQEWMGDGDCDVSDVQEITVSQLQLARGDYTAEAITDAVDAWAELWEPAEGQNRDGGVGADRIGMIAPKV